MCGIMGTYPSSEILVDGIQHRGPDDARITHHNEVTFAQSRLSIVDLSEVAAQPKWSNKKKVLLTFNGEIYNFKSLGLSQTSDTVALADWLETYGPNVDLGKLDGMYAFAAYFVETGDLLLARDPAGIKPLYITTDKNGSKLAFSSEIKGFLGVEWFRPIPTQSQAVVKQFLQYGFAVPIDCSLELNNRAVETRFIPTLLENVVQLCPGQKIVIPRNGPIRSYTTKLASQELPAIADAIRATVSEQLMADVEVGVQLSGGIDSSLVALYFAQQAKRCHGFFVSVDDQRLNEDTYARFASEKIRQLSNFQLHEIKLTKNIFLNSLRDVAWFHDEPCIRHPNAVGIFTLSEYVRKNTSVKVLLTGEGADEMFAGYEWYSESKQQSPELTRRLFSCGAEEFVAPLITQQGTELATQLNFDRQFYLPPILLRQDRMSMAWGLESRVPFLANRFLQMPFVDKIGKPALKKLAAEFFGHDFTCRPKCGFGLPLEWLSEASYNPDHLDWLPVQTEAKSPQQQWVLSSIARWSDFYLYDGWKEKLPNCNRHFMKQTPIIEIHSPLPKAQTARSVSTYERLGLQWRLDQNVYIDRCIIEQNIFEAASTHLVVERIKPGMTVVDIGANIGYFTLLFSRLVGPTGRIIAIEPVEHLRARLIEHLAINNIQNVLVVDCAVGEKEGELTLFYGEDSATSAWMDDGLEPNGSANVLVRPLDAILQEYSVETVDFIKVDIDGGEVPFLRGAEKTLRIASPEVLIEYSEINQHGAGLSTRDITKVLKQYGYEFYDEETKALFKSDADLLRKTCNCSHSVNVLAVPKNNTAQKLSSVTHDFDGIAKAFEIEISKIVAWPEVGAKLEAFTRDCTALQAPVFIVAPTWNLAKDLSHYLGLAMVEGIPVISTPLTQGEVNEMAEQGIHRCVCEYHGPKLKQLQTTNYSQWAAIRSEFLKREALVDFNFMPNLSSNDRLVGML